MNDIFPTTASFVLYLIGPFIAAPVAYFGLNYALAALEWLIDRGAALLEFVGNRFGGGVGGSGDDNFEGYEDMEIPELDVMAESEVKPSLHRRSA